MTRLRFVVVVLAVGVALAWLLRTDDATASGGVVRADAGAEPRHARWRSRGPRSGSETRPARTRGVERSVASILRALHERSDEEVIGSYSKEEIENAGLSPASLHAQAQIMRGLALASEIDAAGLELEGEAAAALSGLMLFLRESARPDPELDEETTLDVERQLLSSIERGLKRSGAREGRAVELVHQMMRGVTDMEAGVRPSTAEALRRQELDYLAGNRGQKYPKDEPGEEVDTHERVVGEDDIGAVFSPLDEAIQRTIESLGGEP